jgi:signal transduction histidine kinase
MKIKSVKSLNPCVSVIQKGCDIVKAHDGELTVEKREKEETVFSIKLPL